MLSDTATESDATVTELAQAGAMLMAELEEAIAARTVADDRITRARAAIEILMGTATEGRVNGRPVISWAPQTSRRFDQATAKRFLTPEQIEACMVESTSRPFRRIS